LYQKAPALLKTQLKFLWVNGFSFVVMLGPFILKSD